jgi:exodeoxyribonuclease VII large subunit
MRETSAGRQTARQKEGRRMLAGRRDRTSAVAGRLHALSPLATLARGYAVPLGRDGRLLRSVKDFAAGEGFTLRVVDGSVGCRVEGER